MREYQFFFCVCGTKRVENKIDINWIKYATRAIERKNNQILL
jgi:uncharacterized protein YifE (UPF0438 family)